MQYTRTPFPFLFFIFLFSFSSCFSLLLDRCSVTLLPYHNPADSQGAYALIFRKSGHRLRIMIKSFHSHAAPRPAFPANYRCMAACVFCSAAPCGSRRLVCAAACFSGRRPVHGHLHFQLCRALRFTLSGCLVCAARSTPAAGTERRGLRHLHRSAGSALAARR